MMETSKAHVKLCSEVLFHKGEFLILGKHTVRDNGIFKTRGIYEV